MKRKRAAEEELWVPSKKVLVLDSDGDTDPDETLLDEDEEAKPDWLSYADFWVRLLTWLEPDEKVCLRRTCSAFFRLLLDHRLACIDVRERYFLTGSARTGVEHEEGRDLPLMDIDGVTWSPIPRTECTRYGEDMRYDRKSQRTSFRAYVECGDLLLKLLAGGFGGRMELVWEDWPGTKLPPYTMAAAYVLDEDRRPPILALKHIVEDADALFVQPEFSVSAVPFFSGAEPLMRLHPVQTYCKPHPSSSYAPIHLYNGANRGGVHVSYQWTLVPMVSSTKVTRVVEQLELRIKGVE
jgi:hypothetical protein